MTNPVTALELAWIRQTAGQPLESLPPHVRVGVLRAQTAQAMHGGYRFYDGRGRQLHRLDEVVAAALSAGQLTVEEPDDIVSGPPLMVGVHYDN
ncbi:MAG: hypothetical protein H6739_32375 [Alphaproteobacteria bacterium]|nr:hypothetical protein [Alphaproteobacteria bacterium]